MKRAGFMGEYEVMQEHLVEAGCALLASLGADVTEVRDGAPLDVVEDVVVSSLGYASESCRGAVVLVTTSSVLRTLDLGVRPPESEADLADVCGELTNMLLGRLKTGVLRHGVAFSVSTPTSFVGREMSLPPPRGGTSSWHRFDGVCGSIYVRFDAIFEPSFVLPPASDVQREGDAAEGDVLVF